MDEKTPGEVLAIGGSEEALVVRGKTDDGTIDVVGVVLRAIVGGAGPGEVETTRDDVGQQKCEDINGGGLTHSEPDTVGGGRGQTKAPPTHPTVPTGTDTGGPICAPRWD